jgi:benzaldehyde dehydrogenase (NAD)
MTQLERERPAAPVSDPGRRRGAWIGGWRDGGGEQIDVLAPATGEVLASFTAASAEVVRAAACAAAAAQPAWEAAGPDERAGLLLAAADGVEARRADIVGMLVRESGSVHGKAQAEVDSAIAELRAAAALAQQPQGRVLPPARPGHTSIARRVPLGVVGVIAPWNVPLLLALRSVAPALALGNTVVLKPDPHTPVCGGAVLAEVFAGAGLPDGVFSLVLGGAETGEALVRDPGVQMISFTGSTATGRRIGQIAGGALKKLALELGGNSPFVVLEDADLERAAAAGAASSFQHQGQICMAASRHLVHAAVAGEYVERLVERARRLRLGDPAADPGVDLGPIIDARQLARVRRIVDESVAAGARILAGGADRGPFFEPTVLTEVTPSMPAFAEEIFGPVAPVTVFRDDDEAVELARMTEYGLAAAVHTRSAERGLALAARLGVGMAHVNDQTVNDVPHAPFGGRGASGNGSRFGGEANWEAFTQWQWLTVTGEPPALPF